LDVVEEAGRVVHHLVENALMAESGLMAENRHQAENGQEGLGAEVQGGAALVAEGRALKWIHST